MHKVMNEHSHHSHSHHGHHCHHGHSSVGRAFTVGITLNIAFVLIEIAYGLQANSLALLADAGHNASDVLGLVIALIAMRLALRKPSKRFTYGLQSASIMAALANALLLLVAVGGISWEALQRLSQPEQPAAMTMIVVASIGVFINGITAYFLHSGHHKDLNIKGAYLHMLADAAVSVGVVISGIVMMNTGWLWIDPLVSLVIALVIVAGTWSLLRDSTSLALHAVPRDIDIADVKAYLKSLNGVSEVHDLHIWAMSTTGVALTAHLLMPSGHPGDAFIHATVHELEHRFNINHATLQIEIGNSADTCALSSHA
jgi:cobalt-zinc-cadmium efflux system protein